MIKFSGTVVAVSDQGITDKQNNPLTLVVIDSCQHSNIGLYLHDTDLVMGDKLDITVEKTKEKS